MPTPSKLETIATEDLLQELVRRRRSYIEQLDSVLAIWKPEAAAAPPPAPGMRATAPARGTTAARSAKRPGVVKGRPVANKPVARGGASRKSGPQPKKGKVVARKNRASRHGAGGKPLDAYILDALRGEGRAMKPQELAPLLSKAGWLTSSKNPTDLLKTYLNRMARSGRHPIRALGGNLFELKKES